MKCRTETTIRNLGRHILFAALAAVLGLPLSATAEVVPASNDCKTCVMKCVMEDGKLFRECVRPYKLGSACPCDNLCIGIDRMALKKELRDAALKKCDADVGTCRKNTGEDRSKQLLCEAAYGACKQNAQGFYDIPH